jgi:hypothetical protein
VGFSGEDDVSVKSLSINGGKLFSTGSFNNLTILGIMTLTAGSIDGPVNIIIKEGANFELLNSSDVSFNANSSGVGSLYNHGMCNLHGAAGIRGLDKIENAGTLNWQTPISIPLRANVDPAAAIRPLQANVFSGSGLVTGKITPLLTSDGASLIGHDGAGILANDGATVIAQGGGNIIAQGGGNVIAQGGGNILANDGATVIAQGGGNVIAQGGGNIIAAGGGNLQGSSNSRAATGLTGYIQNGGETNLSSCNIVGPVTLNGGVLSGSGVIQGNLVNNGGYIAPGHSAGAIGVLGSFTQGANGTLVLENGGPRADQFDQLQVSGVANLGGKLDIRDINGYTPSTLDTFSPLGFNSATGSFSSVSSNAQLTMTANGVLTSVNPSVPAPKAGQPLNIATRLNVLAGDNALIAGFIVTGPNGSTKKVLIRGIAPSLAAFGVPGTMADPLLELHKPDNSVVVNDNWQQGDASQIPNDFAPSDPRESAIVATLTPGNYTAVLKGAHGETGVSLAEVYDLDPDSTAQLANIATRGFVNTGDNVMIGGFIVGGTEPTKVLVRAIGPSLSAFGVQGALPATTLELHDANGAVISNEGWRNTQETEIIATTIPPSNDNEAAILATLVPGNYTAVVRGKGNTTGIGLVEAYNLQ